MYLEVTSNARLNKRRINATKYFHLHRILIFDKNEIAITYRIKLFSFACLLNNDNYLNTKFSNISAVENLRLDYFTFYILAGM